MDKIWYRKSFEVGGHWLLWRGWKNRMTTQNRRRQRLRTLKKTKKDYYLLQCIVVAFKQLLEFDFLTSELESQPVISYENITVSYEYITFVQLRMVHGYMISMHELVWLHGQFHNTSKRVEGVVRLCNQMNAFLLLYANVTLLLKMSGWYEYL